MVPSVGLGLQGSNTKLEQKTVRGARPLGQYKKCDTVYLGAAPCGYSQNTVACSQSRRVAAAASAISAPTQDVLKSLPQQESAENNSFSKLFDAIKYIVRQLHPVNIIKWLGARLIWQLKGIWALISLVGSLRFIQWGNINAEAINQGIRRFVYGSYAVRSTMAAAAAMPALFASLTMEQMKGQSQLFLIVLDAVNHFLRLYILLLFFRVILTWFPTFDWQRQPWVALRQVTDPYLNLFRGIVPPLMGSIDFTPLLGFYILEMISGMLQYQDDDPYLTRLKEMELKQGADNPLVSDPLKFPPNSPFYKPPPDVRMR